MAMKIFLKSMLMVLVFIRAQTVNGQAAMSGTFPSSVQGVDAHRHALKSIKLPSGIRLEYAEQGSASGVPVIFLHGYTDSWQSFSQVLPLLPESIHAYMLSQRGHGNSDRPENGYSPEDFAMDIADFMQELKIS